jgi:hypothetical protein
MGQLTEEAKRVQVEMIAEAGGVDAQGFLKEECPPLAPVHLEEARKRLLESEILP